MRKHDKDYIKKTKELRLKMLVHENYIQAIKDGIKLTKNHSTKFLNDSKGKATQLKLNFESDEHN